MYVLISKKYNLAVCILSIRFHKSDEWFIINIEMYTLSSVITIQLSSVM